MSKKGIMTTLIATGFWGAAAEDVEHVGHDISAAGVGPHVKVWMANLAERFDELETQNARLKTIITEREATIDDLNAPLAAVAVVKFVLECHVDEGMELLRLWDGGEFQEIRDEWDDVPDEVFIGADPLFKQSGE